MLTYLQAACLSLIIPLAPQPLPTVRLLRHCAPCAQLAEDGDGELAPADMAALRARIEKIQTQGGLSTPAQQLFELATEKAPADVMREFYQTASSEVRQAMQEAVMSLFGALPPYEFDSQITTTGDRLAALMLQLQMTGYMLRNAEYVFTLRRLLDIKGKSVDEYRAAFDRIDTDGSGFIEPIEVEKLLMDVYGGEPPPYEASAFLQFFDTDVDGRISWEEFARALGAAEDSLDGPVGTVLAALPASGEEVPGPKVSGTVTIELEDGGTVEMDAQKYMDELKAEAQKLRSDLAGLEQASGSSELAISSSIAAYLSSLSESQLKQLTQGITQDVVEAMKQLVDYILQGGSPNSDGKSVAGDDEVRMEQEKMQQLCMYQLILGYQLREAEAKGEAQQRLGR